jgi:hypothetical protein
LLIFLWQRLRPYHYPLIRSSPPTLLLPPPSSPLLAHTTFVFSPHRSWALADWLPPFHYLVSIQRFNEERLRQKPTSEDDERSDQTGKQERKLTKGPSLAK